MNWNKKLWGVEFSSPRSKPTLVGRSWYLPQTEPYKGEPTRALLFCTRATAREWCRITQAKYASRADVCKDWRFRPVRVTEKVVRQP